MSIRHLFKWTFKSQVITTPKDTLRDKLGLALAGGGFRASLFHIGVFHRLAQLDLLRYVEVISAVSGGSIVAALYALLLKREMEKPDFNGRLTQEQYLKIVDDLETRLCLGIQKNLRTWLFMNPFNIIYGWNSGDHLSRAMARLYEKNLYQQTINELYGNHSGPMRLRDIKIKPGGKSIRDAGFVDLESYNREQVANQGSVITKLILNATSLNSGSRFWFSASEIGEWDSGYLHQDDAETVIHTLKPRIDQARKVAGQKAKNLQALATDPTGEVIAWWASKGETQQRPLHWAELFKHWEAYFVHGNSGSDSLDALLTCKLGILRFARRAAWFLAHWPEREDIQVFGGLTRSQHRLVLATKLGFICHQFTERVETWLEQLEQNGQLGELCALVDDVYLIRSADVLAKSAAGDLEQFPLCHAVAASANFPPVFAPFQLTNFYDDLHVSRLGLTDGGVYDNLGVIGLIDEDCNYLISSDTGLSSGPQRRVSTGRVGMLARIVSVLMDDDARQTREILLERHRVSTGLAQAPCSVPSASASDIAKCLDAVAQTRELFGLAAFKIDSPEVCEREAANPKRAYSAKDLAKIRTDLDAFGDIEMDALINQGYANAGLFLKRWFTLDTARQVPEHLMCRYGANADKVYPYSAAAHSDGNFPEPRQCAKTPSDRRKKHAIKAAHSSMPKVFMVWSSPWCWIAWASLLLLLFAGWCALRGQQLNLVEDLKDLFTQVLFLKQLGLVGEVSWHRFITTLAVVAGAYLLLKLVARYWFDGVDKLRDNGHTGLARWMSAIARIPRLLRAFTTAVIVKLVLLIVVWLVYVYSRLYLWATNRGAYGQSCRRNTAQS